MKLQSNVDEWLKNKPLKIAINKTEICFPYSWLCFKTVIANKPRRDQLLLQTVQLCIETLCHINLKHRSLSVNTKYWGE